MSKLILHSGGFSATLDQIEGVETPRATRTHVPVPHAEILNFGREVADIAGITIKRERHALARDGAQFFALLETNGDDYGDHGFGIGLRNAHDKSLAAALACGANVFVCDNLAFSGDFLTFRKHTTRVFQGLRAMVGEAAEKYVKAREIEHARIELWRERWIERGPQVDHLILNCVRTGILAPTDVPVIMGTVRDVPEKYVPMGTDDDRLTAWCFQNLVTDITRDQSATKQWERTRKLGEILDAEVVSSS